MKLHESWPERLSTRGCTEPQKCNKNGEAAATRNSIARLRHLPGQAIIKLSSRLEFAGKAGRGFCFKALQTGRGSASTSPDSPLTLAFPKQEALAAPEPAEVHFLGNISFTEARWKGLQVVHPFSFRSGRSAGTLVEFCCDHLTQWPTAALKKYRRILRDTREPTPKFWEM